MKSIPSTLLACALVLVAVSSSSAQDAACPTSNRMRLIPFGQPEINLLDGAAYDITFGRTRDRSGNQVMAAFVKRNGVCNMLGAWVFDGAGNNPNMTVDSNLCLGGQNDVVRVLSQNTTINFCGTAIPLNAFTYSGKRIAIYGGGGADELTGGTGKDWLFGGAGNDHLRGGSGADDELYGESGADTLDGSTGARTYQSGGPGGDGIADTQGTGDWLDGGSDNDAISTNCNPPFALACGSGTDWAISRDAAPLGTDCERWDDLVCQ